MFNSFSGLNFDSVINQHLFIMETTILTIESGNNTFYFDIQPDLSVKLCRDEKYINTYPTFGDAFQAWFKRYNAICISLKVTDWTKI